MYLDGDDDLVPELRNYMRFWRLILEDYPRTGNQAIIKEADRERFFPFAMDHLAETAFEIVKQGLSHWEHPTPFEANDTDLKKLEANLGAELHERVARALNATGAVNLGELLAALNAEERDRRRLAKGPTPEINKM